MRTQCNIIRTHEHTPVQSERPRNYCALFASMYIVVMSIYSVYISGFHLFSNDKRHFGKHFRRSTPSPPKKPKIKNLKSIIIFQIQY